MEKIERACRALCHLETVNPDSLIYDPGDIEIGVKRSMCGISAYYHRVKPGKEPKRLWTVYIPWAKTMEAALSLDVDLDEFRRKLAEEYEAKSD